MDSLEIKIIEQAIEAFAEKGFKFTLQDIATSLGISKKTIYTVFDSKEMLLDALGEYGYKQIKLQEESIMNMDIDIVEKIRRVIIAMPDSYGSIDFSRFKELKEKYPAVYDKVTKRIESNWEPTLALLEEGIRQGRIRPINLSILKEIISASMQHFLSSGCLERDNLSYSQALDEMMNIIMEGITL